MTIKTLASKGLARRAIARQLSLTEGTVRYHLRRIAAQASDGRARQVRRAAAHREAIGHWMSTQGEGAGADPQRHASFGTHRPARELPKRDPSVFRAPRRRRPVNNHGGRRPGWGHRIVDSSPEPGLPMQFCILC